MVGSSRVSRDAAAPVLVLNQMAGPIARELAEAIAERQPCVLFTGHPDTIQKLEGTPRAGLSVRRGPTYGRSGYVARVASWTKYTAAAFIWLVGQPRGTRVVVFTNPPLLIPLAWLLRLLRGHRYAVVVHDIYPDVLTAMGVLRQGGFIARAWRFVNRIGLRGARAVVTLGDVMAGVVDAQYAGNAGARTTVVYPWVDVERIRPVPKAVNPFAQRHGQVGRTTFLYSGNMGASHDLRTMLEAANRLRERRDAHFLFVGDGAQAGRVRDASHRLPNVTVLPWQPESDLPFSLTAGDVALVALERGMEGLAVPSKTVYALAAGSAVVALAHGDSELRRWLTRDDCGLVIEPGDADALTSALEQLLDDPSRLARMRTNARRAAELRFASHREAPRLAALLLEALGDVSARPRALAERA